MTSSTWQETSLGEQLTFQRGYDITKKEQEAGPYPVVSSSGVKSYHKAFKVEGPGVAIGRKGTLGTAFYVDNDFWPHDTTLWVKDFHGNYPKFAYFVVQCMGFEQYDCGASNPTLNRNHIHKLPITFPPLPTQRKIASILSVYDDLIENNTRRIAILEEMARAIYRRWFVNFRFPGHENVNLVDSPLGMIPEGWECVTLGDCLSVLETGNRPKGGISGFSEGVVSIGAESIIGAGKFDFAKTKFIPPDYFDKMKKGVVADRDVLVYKDGGKPGYFIPHVSFFGNGFPYHVMR